jgi:hypothetical protein
MSDALKNSLALLAVLLSSAACGDAPAPPPVPSQPPVVSPPAVTRPAGAPSPSAPVTGLPVPFESEGACPFECCVYRTWTVERATDVRAARQKGAPVAFAVKAGEKVEALTGVVVVSRPGRARVSRDATIEGLGALKAGDEVAVLLRWGRASGWSGTPARRAAARWGRSRHGRGRGSPS